MKDQSDLIFKNLMGGSNMVYKSSDIRSLTFMETNDILYLTKDSQPFIGDLNGDMIDDIIFNNAENNHHTAKGRLNVGIYMPEKNAYDVHNFKNAMVDEDCQGLSSIMEKPMLTTPHSVSMPDFDGDCMSDLFITLQDEEDPSKKIYEIYIRREQLQNVTDSSGMTKT